MTIVHHPVLVQEVLEGLGLKVGAVVLDATVGLGGHAEAILEGIGRSGRLVAMDRDQRALEVAQDRLRRFAGQVTWIHGSFGELEERLQQGGGGLLDGVLLDLGVSSLQLEDPQRGFSFSREGPLDMRMDEEEPVKAAEIVNRASIHELEKLLRDFGEERWAGRIARAVVRARPLSTTTQLAEVVRRAVPAGARHGRIHPATRTFQAIRIAVNRELEVLPGAIMQAVNRLRPGGRIAVLSYHSLEDGIVKRTFREQARSGRLAVRTRKPIRPSAEEVARNPRSRSARLRVAERQPVP